MTRGRFAYIAEPSGLCWRTAEFNGDMGPVMDAGYEALIDLKDHGKDFKGFEQIVKKFYDMYELEFDGMLPLPLLPMNIVTTPLTDQKSWGYSDYLYMVNGTDGEVTIKDAKDKEVTFKPGEVKVFNFGEIWNETQGNQSPAV